jgi:hypothetical protein
VEHHTDAVRQVEDVVDVVADEEDPDPLALQLLDQRPYLGRLDGTKRGRRLVDDQDPRVEVDGARWRRRASTFGPAALVRSTPAQPRLAQDDSNFQ